MDDNDDDEDGDDDDFDEDGDCDDGVDYDLVLWCLFLGQSLPFVHFITIDSSSSSPCQLHFRIW